MERSQPKRIYPRVYPKIPFHLYFAACVPGTLGLVSLLFVLQLLPSLRFDFREITYFIPLLVPAALGCGAALCVIKGHRLAFTIAMTFTIYLIVSIIPCIIAEFYNWYNDIFWVLCPFPGPFQLLGIPLQILSTIIIRRAKIGHPSACNASSNSQKDSYSSASPVKDDPLYPHLPGDLLYSRYQIVSGIGRGASGSVYLVKDLKYPDGEVRWVLKEVDLRTLPHDDKQEALELFHRECQLLKGLNHPAIPKLIDYFHDQDFAYMVMEHIAGQSLEAVVLESQRPLDADKVAELALEILQILGYLHSQSPHPLIFRDLKPSNIMMTEKGKLRLIDFGISRFFSPGKVKDTFVFGTPGFSPPEQYGTGQSDERSDIYAFGATLYYLLTLQDLQSFFFMFPPVRRFNRSVTPAFERILSKCLMKNKGERYANMEMLKIDLEKIRSDHQYERQNMLPELWAGLYFLAAIVIQFISPNGYQETKGVHYGIKALLFTLSIPMVALVLHKLRITPFKIYFPAIFSRIRTYRLSLLGILKPIAGAISLQRRIK